jgi:acetyl-CoA acyltransferase
MKLVDYAFVGVEPETMGYGPVPATDRLLSPASASTTSTSSR